MRINGTELNVRQVGEGRPLVMLHGLASNITALQPEIERFSALFQVTAIDSRGHDRSEKPAAYSL